MKSKMLMMALTMVFSSNVFGQIKFRDAGQAPISYDRTNYVEAVRMVSAQEILESKAVAVTLEFIFNGGCAKEYFLSSNDPGKTISQNSVYLNLRPVPSDADQQYCAGGVYTSVKTTLTFSLSGKDLRQRIVMVRSAGVPYQAVLSYTSYRIDFTDVKNPVLSTIGHYVATDGGEIVKADR